ncbi:MAG: hypothetical protein ACLVBD_12935 [Hominilimicola sp.]
MRPLLSSTKNQGIDDLNVAISPITMAVAMWDMWREREKAHF